MSFFDSTFPKQTPAVFDSAGRRGLSPEALGVMAAGPVVLAASDDAVVALQALVAFPSALRFDLVAMLRVPIAEEPEHKPWHSTTPAFHCMWPPYDPGPGFVRFGVRFASGERFDNLSHGGGAGSSGPTYGQTGFWVPDLPGSGQIELFVEWEAVGIGESVSYLDGDHIREAAAKAIVPWS